MRDWVRLNAYHRLGPRGSARPAYEDKVDFTLNSAKIPQDRRQPTLRAPTTLFFLHAKRRFYSEENDLFLPHDIGYIVSLTCQLHSKTE